MSRIERKEQKIFGSQAGSREITEFGTAKSTDPIYTTDLSVIQNTNFLNGWSSALLPDKSPWEEDMNALFYAVTKQIAYIFQEGTPAYDTNTTYYLGSLVKNIDNSGNVTIYKSLKDENIGNPLSDITSWSTFQSDGSLQMAGYEIGLPQPTFSNTLLPNEIWLEGQEISRTTYPQLFEIYGTTYGAGNGSTTFNLPDCRNRVMWGSNTFGYVSAGLPNITGSFKSVDQRDNWGANGVFRVTRGGTAGIEPEGNVFHYTDNFTFDASRSSAVYGASSTVQPPGIKVRVKTRFK